jgi:hypothetical protein
LRTVPAKAPVSGFRLIADGRTPCQRRRRAVLVLATIGLSGCATDVSDVVNFGACPPFVEYRREFQVRAAVKLAQLPEGWAIKEMISEYAVTREQAWACFRKSHCL